MVVTGLGMALTVAPLTTSVLAAVRPAEAGIASGVNNTAARVGTLLAVAIIGVVALALYGRALERRLARRGGAGVAARALVAERRSLADTTIPDVGRRPADRASLATARGRRLPRRLSRLGAPCARRSSWSAPRSPPRCSATTDAAATEAADGPDVRARRDHHRATTRTRADARSACGRATRGSTSALCLACGHVGCCDSSKNQHATKHFWSSQHPIVRSLEPGEELAVVLRRRDRGVISLAGLVAQRIGRARAGVPLALALPRGEGLRA